ncbi:hypothetical protein LTR08_008809 [Meristemomyces frigidus]|nr:hypothetical protein LTR08_008809 [Meristemomyces frigidus]
MVLNARLQRLEEAVFGGQIRSAAPDATLSQGLNCPSTTQVNSPEAAHAKAYSADSRWLEGVSSQGLLQLPGLYGEPCIQIASLATIAAGVTAGDKPTATLLPCVEESMQLFHSYLEHLDALQHIIHVPSVIDIIQQLYVALQSGQPVSHSHVALTLAILASTATYWGLGDASGMLFASVPEALAVGTYWLKSTLDMLEDIVRTGSPDLETVQTTILAVFLIYHTEGTSPQLQHLHASALPKAKGIGLHLTDSIHSARPEETREQIIDAEMRRRVWWHLASTDWILSLSGGPHEGTYSVHPRHMQVKKPRNVTDEDIITQSADFTRPESEATPNSYYFQRIRVAEACRDVADVTWELAAVRDPAQVAYKRIIALDRRFAALMEEMPDVLRLAPDVSKPAPMAGISSAQLEKQRYFIYIVIQTRRAKLHLPFLLRVQQDERFVFSREMCLSSARAVLALRTSMPNPHPQFIGPMRLVGIVRHFFLALVVLTMDICVNKAAGDVEGRKTEVQEAFGVLEDARNLCATATTFLESLVTVLQKHRVRLGRCPHGVAISGRGTTPTDDDADYSLRPGTARIGNGDATEFDFDGLWRSYFDFGANADAQNWDALFSDLDTANGAV